MINLCPISMVSQQSSTSGQEIRSKSMKGLILHLSEGGGLISGDDDSRYTFLFADILTNPKQIFAGSRVDFQIENRPVSPPLISVEVVDSPLICSPMLRTRSNPISP